jgi:predicted nucleotidyltransferase component of viral defense system
MTLKTLRYKKMDRQFKSQSELLLDVLPFIAEESIFALKGGTAINFFVRDLPRLSVDIDLTYVPVESRDVTLERSVSALTNISQKLKSKLGAHIIVQRDLNKQFITKLDVQTPKAQIKIEPNYICRGTVYPIHSLATSNKVEELLGRTLKFPVLSVQDLYAGKLCAFLNRQHPRDIFDIKILLENEGLSKDILDTFIVYLASDSRPINELLWPNLLDFSDAYNSDFRGMTNNDVSMFELLEVRNSVCGSILHKLTANHKAFLLSIVDMSPDWSLLNVPNDISELPGLKFKLINLARMSEAKRSAYKAKLCKLFES